MSIYYLVAIIEQNYLTLIATSLYSAHTQIEHRQAELYCQLLTTLKEECFSIEEIVPMYLSLWWRVLVSNKSKQELATIYTIFAMLQKQLLTTELLTFR